MPGSGSTSATVGLHSHRPGAPNSYARPAAARRSRTSGASSTSSEAGIIDGQQASATPRPRSGPGDVALTSLVARVDEACESGAGRTGVADPGAVLVRCRL